MRNNSINVSELWGEMSPAEEAALKAAQAAYPARLAAAQSAAQEAALAALTAGKKLLWEAEDCRMDGKFEDLADAINLASARDLEKFAKGGELFYDGGYFRFVKENKRK